MFIDRFYVFFFLNISFIFVFLPRMSNLTKKYYREKYYLFCLATDHELMCFLLFFFPLPPLNVYFQVSWIRKRDLHILTVGILTYTNDQRFQAMHQEGSDEWTLKISSPQPRDSGTYECQVSMEPKISQAFRLVVIGKCLNPIFINFSFLKFCFLFKFKFVCRFYRWI